MTGINWNLGQPPESQRGKRLLLIASPIVGNLDAAADNRLDIYVGHVGDFGEANMIAFLREYGACPQIKPGRHWL
jgi:hypothetical protein